MTTYAYRIILEDSESIMFEEALKMMIEHCDEKLKAAAEEIISLSKAANLSNQKLAQFRKEFIAL